MHACAAPGCDTKLVLREVLYVGVWLTPAGRELERCLMAPYGALPSAARLCPKCRPDSEAPSVRDRAKSAMGL